MLNLILGFLWLAAAIALFSYELVTGQSPLRIRALNISSAWILVLLAAWNFVRWYSSRASQAEREALRLAHEARQRRTRYHERPPEPDPTFDFTDKPSAPPPSRQFTDRPPSSN
jgi:hypothetical protein